MTNSLSHTKWMCKYHIVFTPKYRRKVIDNCCNASIVATALWVVRLKVSTVGPNEATIAESKKSVTS